MCTKCADSGWVCENHPDLPFSAVCIADNACNCGGAGMPCECDPMSKDTARVVPFKRKKLSGFIQDADTSTSDSNPQNLA